MQRQTVRQTVRDHYVRKYPWLAEQESFMRHLRRMLYSTHRSTEGWLLCGQPQVAADQGQLVDGHYASIPFLEDFQSRWGADRYRILPHEYTGNKQDGKVRRVEFRQDPDDYAVYFQELRGDFAADKRVYWVSGEVYSEQKHRKMLAAERERARQEVKLVSSPQTRRICEYMNDRSPVFYSRMLNKNMAQAYKVALRLPDTSQERALRDLAALQDNPYPLYRESPLGHTDRAFCGSLQTIQGDVRKALTQGLVTGDLASAQMAINAKEWGIDSIVSYLEKGNPTWPLLVSAVRPDVDSTHPDFEPVKKLIKDDVYAISYGMCVQNLKKELRKLRSFGVADPESFLNHWMIRDLLLARDRRIQQVVSQGYAETCFGKKIPVATLKGEQTKTNAPSALAECAQAQELNLIMPAFDLARETHEFQIVVYLFDGLSFSFENVAKQTKWMRLIKEAIDNKAKTLGIPTRWEWK